MGTGGQPVGDDENSVSGARMRMWARVCVSVDIIWNAMCCMGCMCVNMCASHVLSGGSSGGEAALIASHGSLLGIGTDIGGSLRIPAHFCGIFAFKPTPARITFHGMASPFVGDGT